MEVGEFVLLAIGLAVIYFKDKALLKNRYFLLLLVLVFIAMLVW